MFSPSPHLPRGKGGGCRVGGGALARWPPSAAQTARADFPHAAFTLMRLAWTQSKVSIQSSSPDQTRHTTRALEAVASLYCAIV